MLSRESAIRYTAIGSLTVLLIISGFFVIKGWHEGHFESVESFRTYISSFGVWAPGILMMIQMIQVVLPVLPGFMGCFVGSAIFGALEGFWINYIGISAGSIAAYWIAKIYGVKLVSKMISMKKYESYIKRINKSKNYTKFLFVATLLPLFPDDFLCYFSGLIKMSAKKFVFIIVIGKPWCILFYSVFFSVFFT